MKSQTSERLVEEFDMASVGAGSLTMERANTIEGAVEEGSTNGSSVAGEEGPTSSS